MLMWNKVKAVAAAVAMTVLGTGIGIETIRRATAAGPSTAPTVVASPTAPLAVGPALPAVRAARPTSRPAKPVPGEIMWMDGDRIAAMPSPGPTEDHPYGSVTYLMDDRTQVLIMTRTKSTTAPDGRVTELHYASKPGSRKDLKVGLRTHIIADGEKASRIMVFFDDPQQP